MSSILDDYILDKEHFEGSIAVGSTMSQVLTMFNKTRDEIESWCQENYCHDFRTTYEMIRQLSFAQFKSIVMELGYRGNPSALKIMSDALMNEKADSITKIEFNVNIKPEGEEDK